MKETMWGYWIIVLGIFVVVVMMLLNNFTTTSQQDYYLLREVTNAALHESLDWAHYRLTEGAEVRINKEKFVENWMRRFAETININRYYTIGFFDIFEAPPKVSVQVATTIGSFGTMGTMDDSFDVVNRLNSIFEYEQGPRPPEVCHWGVNPTPATAPTTN